MPPGRRWPVWLALVAAAGVVVAAVVGGVVLLR
jgi:hypothetical protein